MVTAAARWPQDMYFSDHPYGLVPVAVNDVVFALHALFACIVTVLQCFIYEVRREPGEIEVLDVRRLGGGTGRGERLSLAGSYELGSHGGCTE